MDAPPIKQPPGPAGVAKNCVARTMLGAETGTRSGESFSTSRMCAVAASTVPNQLAFTLDGST